MAAEDWIEDGYDDEYWDPSCAIGTQSRACQFCGQEGLHWEQTSHDQWRLHDYSGRLHRCKPEKIDRGLARKVGWALPDLHKPKRSKTVGLFNRKPVYVSDRGDEYDVDSMEPSHLLNAINHHRTQIDTVDWILEQGTPDSAKNQLLHLRRISLFNTVEALVKELRTRDPDEDHADRL